MFRIPLLFAVAIWMCLGGSCALTCHCLNNATCDSVDGSCPTGCEKGWYGPGCQIGNIAFKKPAFQLSTYGVYTAENAVDGIAPPNGDTSERHCSHTAEITTGFTWWYVTLSELEDFVIKNITLVNRQGDANGQKLRNFYILYASDLTAPPDPTSWKRCAFQSSFQATTVAIYTCKERTAIGRRVAVYLMASNKISETDKLTLCEVYVDGYSYKATSVVQLTNSYVTTGCDSFQMNFSTLSIVPPTYLLVQLVNSNEGNVTLIERMLYNGSGFGSVNVRAMANRTYAVVVAPEICCIGSRCLDNGMLDNSKCIIGQSTPPVLVTMPLYTQYKLQNTGDVVNISTVNPKPCSPTHQRITCSRSQGTGGLLVNCSNSGSCQLDARYNYTCGLDLFFGDGFNQTSTENFHISTASFSKFAISASATCNSVTLVMENVTAWWDLEPSVIEFYLFSMGTNDTKVMRVPANTTGNISATFLAMSNSSYSVWAVPVTYLGPTQSPAASNGSCPDSRNCIVGERTPVKVISTLQRQYFWKTEGCCASVADVKSEQCEPLVSHNITCTIERNDTFERNDQVLASDNGLLCGLKASTDYTCIHTVLIRSGVVESYSHVWTTVTVTKCSTLEESKEEKPNDRQITSAAIGGAVAGLVVLVTVVTLLAICQRRRKTLKNRKASSELPSVGKREADFVRAYGNIGAPDDVVYGNTVGMGIEEFECYSRDETAIMYKFTELHNNKGHPCAVGLQNTQKNRFKNIVPYDFNRVLINEGTCNYINASYINGFNQEKKYIATQGPISGTLTDFWKMVWQEKVATIIMLTDYLEQSKKKCERYFPRTGNDNGGISVALKEISTFDTHCVSILNVCHDGVTREVRHCHFLAWPDKSVPEHCGQLLMFYAKTREVQSSKNIQAAPVVVHCSAGVGRTGAFIALDFLMSRFFSEGHVDVDSCVLQLRDQRMNMVQTKEQYVFLHKVLLYGLKTFECIRNSTDLQQSSIRSRPQFENFISKEFEILQASLTETHDDSVYAAARSEDNLPKNRNLEILASESTRPFLGAITGALGGYINAVYCNGCYAKKSFIATQWPLKDTITEFWELVYDRNPSCIVLLHQSPSPEEYPEFYPQQGRSLTAGHFIVKNESPMDKAINNLNEHDLTVKCSSRRASNQEECCSLRLMECYAFEFDNDLPTDLQQTASLIMSLQLVCKQSNDRPLIVICKDGATFCGLFVAAINSLHRFLESNQVQVFHTVDLLRASRPQFISSMRQYQFLYQLLSCCTEARTLYANLPSSSE